MTEPLTNVQAELLQTFDYELSEADFAEFRQMLVNYFAEKISSDVDQLFKEKGWTSEKSVQWVNSHMRTPYTGGN